MLDLSTGRDSNVRSANRCTPTLSRLDQRSIRLLIRLMKLLLRLPETTSYLNPCLSIRIPRGISIYWQWHLNRLNSNLDVVMSPKSESMISVSVDVTLSLSASRMVSTSKTIPLSSEPSSFLRISSDWRPIIPWLFKLAGLSSVLQSSMYNQKRRNWNPIFRKSLMPRTRQWDLWRASPPLRTQEVLALTMLILHYTCSKPSTLSRSTCQWRMARTETFQTREMLFSTIMTTKTTFEVYNEWMNQCINMV